MTEFPSSTLSPEKAPETMKKRTKKASKSYKTCIVEALGARNKKEGVTKASMRSWIKSRYPKKAESKVFNSALQKSLTTLLAHEQVIKLENDRFKLASLQAVSHSVDLHSDDDERLRNNTAFVDSQKPRIRIRLNKPRYIEIKKKKQPKVPASKE